jgi:RecA-family ATPase
MSTDRFGEGFASWRMILASLPADDFDGLAKVFDNAVKDVAGYVLKGLDRAHAVDELHAIALAHGLIGHFGEDAMQARIAEKFQEIEHRHEQETGRPNGKSQAKPVPLLTPIDLKPWDGAEIPQRRWIVPERIPARNVTLFSGEGGVGKTLLMMQLAVATVLGQYWLGQMPEQGPVLFITAEDDEDEIHTRMARIVDHYHSNFRDLGDLHLLSLAGKDAVMAATDGKGIVRPTPLFAQLCATARAIRPRWIGLDTVADVFVCDERNRVEARQCVSLLRGLCLEIDTAIVLLSHPSLSGIASGSGMSGSTAWNNSVRARLYLKTPPKREQEKGDDDDDEPQSQIRILETMKSNYGAKGEPIRLSWREGLLLQEEAPTPMQKVAQEADALAVFLAILQRFNKQDLTASASQTARNFAPRIFAEAAEAKALSPRLSTRKKILRVAMETLLHKERIYQGTGPQSVPPSKRNPCLYAGGTLL